MDYYTSEVNRIKNICHSNQAQIHTVIGTKSCIDNNFGTKLNLDRLSFVRSTSKYHLLRLFKKYYGFTPRQYLIQKRINHSKELLRMGKTVTETCFEVGFESLGSFITLFKRKTGKTPSEYKNEQLSRSEAKF